MKTIKLISFLVFSLFFTSDVFSQASTHYYAIQLATYSSWADFAKDEKKFYENTGTADNNIYGEKVGNSIKVYLLDSQEGSATFFYDYDRTKEVLDVVRANPNWKGAFRKAGVNWDNLTYYGDVFEQYKQEVPAEFSSKGERINTESDQPGAYASAPAAEAKEYKVQLGVYKEEKSKDFIIKTYGFSDVDIEYYDDIVSYDFVKVKNDICRRYYVGEFYSKKTAEPFKKDFEKKSKRKLMIVQR